MAGDTPRPLPLLFSLLSGSRDSSLSPPPPSPRAFSALFRGPEPVRSSFINGTRSPTPLRHFSHFRDRTPSFPRRTLVSETLSFTLGSDGDLNSETFFKHNLPSSISTLERHFLPLRHYQLLFSPSLSFLLSQSLLFPPLPFILYFEQSGLSQYSDLARSETGFVEFKNKNLSVYPSGGGVLAK